MGISSWLRVRGPAARTSPALRARASAGPAVAGPAAVLGMAWGDVTEVPPRPPCRAFLERAALRRGVVSGRCVVDLVLRRGPVDPPHAADAGADPDDAVRVLLDGEVVGELPAGSAAGFAAALRRAGLVDVQVPGLIAWPPDLRAPQYAVRLFAADPEHLVPANRPTAELTMRAHAWCGSVTAPLHREAAQHLADHLGSPGALLPDVDVSLWVPARVRSDGRVEVGVIGAPITVCNGDLAAAVLRRTDGLYDLDVNVEARFFHADAGPRLRLFYPVPWVRQRGRAG